MAEVLNQFTYDDAKGRVVNGAKGFSISAKLSGTAVSGEVVKLKNVSGSKVYVVEAITADTDEIFGVIPYESSKKNEYVDGDMITVMSDYTLIVCEASAAISAGAQVMPVVTDQKVATATSGKSVLGHALQPAAADGDLLVIKVESDISAVELSTIVELEAGATAVLPITAQIVEITTTAASAISLADGSDGQRLTIILVVDGGTATITPANLVGASTTITMADAGDAIDLVFVNSTWFAVGNTGAVIA